MTPQFLGVVHIVAKGAQPLEELHKVNISTVILVEDICEILSAKIFNGQYLKFNIENSQRLHYHPYRKHLRDTVSQNIRLIRWVDLTIHYKHGDL